ncbi:MAG TPA: class I SAM-dependent DNA methyltransferase [Acidothermaceae bacterium]|jgi:type I restriction enzyme M protein|nr:class I SAM-dependent DNA methyltransferase [Acidothermaceae bacterium]
MTSQQIVAKLWSYCHILRDTGVGTLDYVEQLTFLLFLKMADEQYQLTGRRVIPEGYDWPSLLTLDGDELESHYRKLLETLGKQPGALGAVFQKATNKVQQPAVLRRLIVDLIGNEDWSSLDADVKGDAYEGLIAKGITDGGSKAGQYFTPRALIEAIVDVMDPQPGDTITDPACGTGGFILAAHQHIIKNNPVLDPDQRKHLRDEAFRGVDIGDLTYRLCVMNMLLHGIGSPTEPPPISRDDALAAHPGRHFSMVLANPPFGRKSSVTIVSDEGDEEREDLTIYRDDFWTTTSNKQLNFVQHIKTILAIDGRAGVVLPDNVLFEAGAGEVIRRNLLAECDVHTILRLPTGIFYAQGVKANVVFFDRKRASETPWTREVWIYDLRTNKHFTLKRNPLTRADLDEFVSAYSQHDRSKRIETERFKRFSYDEIIARDKLNLDIIWLKDDSDVDASSLPEPDVLIAEIVEELMAAALELAAAATPPEE